jgi:hypothetical protein
MINESLRGGGEPTINSLNFMTLELITKDI